MTDALKYASIVDAIDRLTKAIEANTEATLNSAGKGKYPKPDNSLPGGWADHYQADIERALKDD